MRNLFVTYNLVDNPHTKDYTTPTINLITPPLKQPEQQSLTQQAKDKIERVFSYKSQRPSNNENLTFKQMIEKYGEGKIKVSNWNLRDKNANFGAKNSYHKQAHESWKNEDGTPLPKAFDVTPTSGYSFDDLRTLFKQPVWREWFKKNGFGIIDEANGKPRSWKSTGNHLHIGPDSLAIKEYEEMLKMQEGGSFVTSGSFLKKHDLPILSYTDYIKSPIFTSNNSSNNSSNYQFVFSNKSVIPTKTAISFSGDKKEFLSKMIPVISYELERQGISKDFAKACAAQLAYESGWGKKLSGKNNFGGIKATKSEQGTVRTTHEYENNLRVKQDAKFKDYDTLEDFVKDYVSKLKNKFNAFKGRPEDMAINLGNNKYYTAPISEYNKTFLSIYRNI